MSGHQARYSVGIDLGTTHCVIARADPEARRATAAVDILPVAQLQAPGEGVEQDLLPSFLYLPGAHELPEGSTDLPWGPADNGVVGELARRRVALSPDRVVHSAKSWLCHEGVDRRAPFLPRSAAELDYRVSPVQASAAYLHHLRQAWDHQVSQGDRALTLAEQDILLTVPASFGEAARQLTVEAGRMAGLNHLHLVEEPQAAFYAWLARHAGKLEEALAGLQLILVVDVGGGTTDLTLIRVRREEDDEGAPQLERVAVGEHLMLGGDNMDLALAALAESRLASSGRGGKLDGRAWQALRQSCRAARELLLADQAPDSASVVIPGRGSSLIGGQRKVELSRDEVVTSVLDGFFPEVRADAVVQRRQGLGLREWGLPYAQDVAVTRHVAEFIRRYRKESKDQAPVDAVLFNGGVLNSPRVARRLMEVIQSWTPANGAQPRLLSSHSLDLAVAYGAGHYGLVRRGRGLRIVSGLSHAVYIGLEVRKKKRGRRRARSAALCLAPRGLQEGQELELKDRPLNLTVGQEVVFPLFEAKGKGGKPGEVRSADDPSLVSLPPLRTHLPGSGSRPVPVTLKATLSEVGTLEVVAQAKDGDQRYQLEFDMRAREGAGPAEADHEGQTITPLDSERMEQASTILTSFFGEEAEPPKWKLLPRLEKVLKSKRDNWPLPSIRSLFEVLRPDLAYYNGPAEIQGAWYNLVGFCLRPGFGYPGDEARMELMLPVLKAGCRSWDPRARTEWWVLWRRLAGGLDRKTQQWLFKNLLIEMGLTGRRPEELPPASAQELMQLWMLAASLERVSVKNKVEWGDRIVQWLAEGHKVPEGYWCLGRLGARVPVHGGLDSVVPADKTEAWLESLLQLDRVSQRDQFALCLMLLSRRTDDRSRDISEEMRDRVLDRLTRDKTPASRIIMVEQVVEDELLDHTILGESLPPGLRLTA
jgi:molecular chaperone DnaK (HSP70)